MYFAALTLVFCATFSVFSKSEVQAITNAEFFDLVQPYITGLEIADDNDNDAKDVEIELPGGPDDELDVEYVFKRLGLPGQDGDDTLKVGEKRPDRLSWWHHHHHHHHHHHKPICSCQRDKCTCCLSHKFKINLIFHKFRFHLSACLEVAYLPQNTGFEVTITVNGHRLFHKEISLKHPPRLCFGLPFVRRFAKVCFELYNIDLHSKRICARLTFEINVIVHKFHFHLHLACFHIPLREGSRLDQTISDPNFLTVDIMRDDLTEHDAGSGIDKPQDVIEMFRELQRGILETSDSSQLEDDADLELELQNDTK